VEFSETLAIIVNYKVADLTLRAVQSVICSESQGPLKVVVVDNSEERIEAEKLYECLPAGVKLIVTPKNIGFGRACNMAFERFSGEYILLLNPDARLLPGCLIRLQKTLSSVEKVAAVAPQAFWDDGLTHFLPPGYPVWRPYSFCSSFLPVKFILSTFVTTTKSPVSI